MKFLISAICFFSCNSFVLADSCPPVHYNQFSCEAICVDAIHGYNVPAPTVVDEGTTMVRAFQALQIRCNKTLSAIEGNPSIGVLYEINKSRDKATLENSCKGVQ
ncbi:MAG: hypothetical protein ACXWRE_06300 [Pseudobdellovibrionaceae bacterium]